MLGLILCGGQSSRMKSDKGLLTAIDKTWAQLAAEKLMSLHLQTVLSIRQEQFQHYQPLFQNNQLLIDDPSLNLAGRLLGIMSTHVQFPDEDFVVLACDLPEMKVVVLEELLHQFNTKNGSEAIAFKLDNRIEPLCGVYTAKGLARILVLLNENKLSKFSLLHVLEILDTKYIQAEENWKEYFKNFNSPEDLK